jgi:hypothetical protein
MEIIIEVCIFYLLNFFLNTTKNPMFYYNVIKQQKLNCSSYYKVPTSISLLQNYVSTNVLHFPKTLSFRWSPSIRIKIKQEFKIPNANVQWPIPICNALYIQKQCNLPNPLTKLIMENDTFNFNFYFLIAI